MAKTCDKKPCSEGCAQEIAHGAESNGCGGCPVSKGTESTCVSTHPNAKASKKNSATTNALAAKLSNKKKEISLV